MLLSPYSYPAAEGAVSPPGNLAPFLQYQPLERPFLPSRWALSSVFSSLLCQDGNQAVETRDAFGPQYRSHQAAVSVYLMASAISQRSVQIRLQRSSSSRCGLSRPSTQLPIQRHEAVPCVQVSFRAVAQVPACLPKLSPSVLCGLLVQKPVLHRGADNRFGASLLDVRCRLKSV